LSLPHFVTNQIGDAFGKFFRPIEERQKQLEDELPKLQAEIDFLRVNSFSSDQVMNDAVYLQESWPRLERAEKRKIVECITNKIVVSKEEITIDLCYLPSSKELSKRDWSLEDSFPFCHLRLKCSKKAASHGPISPESNPLRDLFVNKHK
jgi:hypothetical protein